MTGLFRALLFGIGALALLAGIIVSVIWFRSSGKSTVPKSVDLPLAVLAAKHAVAAGTLLGEGDLVWLTVAMAAPPPDSFVRGKNASAELVGALTRHNFSKGEIVISTALLRPSERGFLAATLIPGYRAVTIAASAEQSASGLVLPGDRVDVILVQNIDDRTPARKSVGETVISNARVVAVGHMLGPLRTKPGTTAPGIAVASSDPAPAATITLEVLPTDAQRLVVAGGIGKLELALRAVGDIGISVPLRPVWAGDVSNALRTVVGAPVASTENRVPGVMPPAGQQILPLRRPVPVAPSVLILRGPGGGVR